VPEFSIKKCRKENPALAEMIRKDSRNIPIAQRRKCPVVSSSGRVRATSKYNVAWRSSLIRNRQGCVLCGEGVRRAIWIMDSQRECMVLPTVPAIDQDGQEWIDFASRRKFIASHKRDLLASFVACRPLVWRFYGSSCFFWPSFRLRSSPARFFTRSAGMVFSACLVVFCQAPIGLCFAKNFPDSGSALFVCYPAPSPASELKILRRESSAPAFRLSYVPRRRRYRRVPSVS